MLSSVVCSDDWPGRWKVAPDCRVLLKRADCAKQHGHLHESRYTRRRDRRVVHLHGERMLCFRPLAVLSKRIIVNFVNNVPAM